MVAQSRQRAVVRAVHVPYPGVAPGLQEKELDKFLVRGHLTRLEVARGPPIVMLSYLRAFLVPAALVA